MKLKNFFDTLLFYVSVPKCVSCKERLERHEKAICKNCFDKYSELLKQNCSICAKPYNECTCSNEYLERHGIKRVIKAYRYSPGTELPTNSLLYSLKRENRGDVIEFLTEELYKAFINNNIKPENTLITNVPRRKSSIRKYGYDHSEKIAKALAGKLGLEYKSLVVSKTKFDQKSRRDKSERIKNASFDYKLFSKNIEGQNVIIVDDIITTGASISGVATLMKGLGAKKITAATIAISYIDKYIPFFKK